MPISDAELVEWLRDGSLVVGLDNPATIENNGRSVKAYDDASDQKRWKFSIRRAGRRRTIIRAKLVYLAGSLREIPEGFEIHHVDFDRANDVWENVIALSPSDHLKLHRQTNAKLDEDFANGF